MNRFFDQVVAPLLQINGNSQTINSQSIVVKETDSAGLVILASGTVLVTAGGAGYGKSCIYAKTDAANGVEGLYTNIGTSTSCLFVTIRPQYLVETISSVAKTRLSTGTVTGTPVVGATLSQATSGATGVVTAVGTGYLDVGTVTGTFDATHVVTGTNPDTTTFTFTPALALLDVWQFTNYVSGISVMNSNSGVLGLVLGTAAVTTGKARFRPATDQLETLHSDGFTSVTAEITA